MAIGAQDRSKGLGFRIPPMRLEIDPAMAEENERQLERRADPQLTAHARDRRWMGGHDWRSDPRSRDAILFSAHRTRKAIRCVDTPEIGYPIAAETPMRIDDLIALRAPTFSFEFFPPKTPEGEASLFRAIDELKRLGPSYVSVTYGAGGSTRSKTIEWVRRIKHDVGVEAMAHLTCVGSSRDELAGILEELERAEIDNVLLLRGDPPKGESEFRAAEDGFGYASELIGFARDRFPRFAFGAACYPEKHVECDGAEQDLEHLKHKVEQGVDFLISQLFFDNRAYFAFVERARSAGIELPIIAGIMPITNVDQVRRFTTMCGASIPAELNDRLEAVRGDKAKVLAVGVDHATEQCKELLAENVPGIHFYTLNRSPATREIYMNLLRSRKMDEV